MKVASCCSRASRASASRGSSPRSRTGSRPSRTPECSISSRPTIRPARFIPIISQLGRAAGFQRDDDAAARLDKLDALLARTATTLKDAALIADLLSLPTGDRYPTLSLSPQQRKDKTLAALIRQLEALARERPVLMVFEDAHWSDPSSRELLDLTIDRIQRLPVLLILTFRPEFQPAWTGQSHVTTLVLNRLQRRDGEALVKQMLGNRALPDEIVKEIVERTDGVPLFVEELTKSVLETGLGAKDAHKTLALTPSPALAVPVTLHAPLMARLDGLGAAKDIAQFGSAIGREFSFDLLSAVAERPSGELEAGLARLVAAGLIFQRGTPPQATYLFKHALIQDAAYSTLLREPRQRLHARIAEALQEQSSETTMSTRRFWRSTMRRRVWLIRPLRVASSLANEPSPVRPPRKPLHISPRGSPLLPNWLRGARSKSSSWTFG